METSFFLYLLSVLVETPINILGSGTQVFFMGRARTFMTTAIDTKANGEMARNMGMALTPGQMEPSGLATLGTTVVQGKRD